VKIGQIHPMPTLHTLQVSQTRTPMLLVEKLLSMPLIYLDLLHVAWTSPNNFIFLCEEGVEAPSIVNEWKFWWIG